MNNNQLIVNERETGKTTYLFNEIGRLISEGFGIVVLDSATEHEDKSLIKKIINKYDSSIIINMHDESQVVLENINTKDFIDNFMDYFPFNDVVKNRDKIICFDLSYFLEKAYKVFDETNDKKSYYYYRRLYNMLAQQIALALILMEKHKIIEKKFVIMDEIEFPIINHDISKLQNNLDFIASVHFENAFGTFYESFDIMKFKVYSKRKD